MLVQVYVREAVSRRMETTKDEPRSSSPSTSRTPEMIEKVWLMLAQDRRLALWFITEELGSSKDTTHTIVPDDLGKRKYSPDLCRISSQTTRKQNGWKLLEASFPCVTRIHCFWRTSLREMRPGVTISTRNQIGNRWRTVHRLPRDQKESSARIQGQNTVGHFFDNKGIIHKEFVPAGQTINGPFYHAILNRLLQRIWRVRPELHRTAKWMLLYTNVPAHNVIRVRQFLAQTIVAVFDHPPYSLIWLLRTSSFPAWGRPSKVHVLWTWMPSKICDSHSATDSSRGLFSLFPEAVRTL